jgi:hypothetical protein
MLLLSKPAPKIMLPPVQDIQKRSESEPIEIELPQSAQEKNFSENQVTASPELEALNAINIAEATPSHVPMMANTQTIGTQQILSKDEFWAAFKGVFNMGGMFIRIEGQQLKTIAIQPSEETTAREASDAIYDTCAEIPWLRFILEPENVYVKRALVIGVFFYGKAEMIKAEIQLLQAQGDAQMKEVNPKEATSKAEESKPKKGEWKGGIVEL